MCLLFVTILYIYREGNTDKRTGINNGTIKTFSAPYDCPLNPNPPREDTDVTCATAYGALVTALEDVSQKKLEYEKKENLGQNSLKRDNYMKKKTADAFIAALDTFLSTCAKTKCETSCSILLGEGLVAETVTGSFKTSFLNGCNPATATTTPTPSASPLPTASPVPTASPGPVITEESSGSYRITTSGYLIVLSFLLTFTHFKC
jgi:hypothetical protein